MFTVQFFEKNSLLLSQLTKNLPSISQDIRIKGRKGKVINVVQVKENLFQVQVLLEQPVKAHPLLNDKNKKKR